MRKTYTLLITLMLIMCAYCNLNTATPLTLALKKLKHAYPDHILSINDSGIMWTDTTYMPLDNGTPTQTTANKLDNPSLQDQLEQPLYVLGEPSGDPIDDPGRIRYEPFFRKMYGNSPQEVEGNLVEIQWMPNTFGHNARILHVTKVNNIHKKIEKISDELEALVLEHPKYITFLSQPGGTYCWRNIANTTRLSNHSFGMTIDINASQSQYWQWDLTRDNKVICEQTPLTYRNTIPWKIVSIFEKYGFIWGGKWYHYDTMHFEYRPELIVNS